MGKKMIQWLVSTDCLTYRCTGYRLRPAGDPRATRPPVPFWGGHNATRAVSKRAENWVTERPSHVVFGTVRHTSKFHTVLAQEEEFHHRISKNTSQKEFLTKAVDLS